jgi:hypothetical protein
LATRLPYPCKDLGPWLCVLPFRRVCLFQMSIFYPAWNSPDTMNMPSYAPSPSPTADALVSGKRYSHRGITRLQRNREGRRPTLAILASPSDKMIIFRWFLVVIIFIAKENVQLMVTGVVSNNFLQNIQCHRRNSYRNPLQKKSFSQKNNTQPPAPSKRPYPASIITI